MEDDFPAPAARKLLEKIGLAPAKSESSRLAGGRNNRVWRLETETGPVLLKQYFREGAWDRLAAESRFLKFCESRGLSRVPRLLAEDGENGLALHSWLAGKRPDPDGIGRDDVGRAAAFLGELAVASRQDQLRRTAPARDACLDFEDFFRSPRERLADLESALKESPVSTRRREALEFLRNKLRPAHERARQAVLASPGKEESRRFFLSQGFILSPSDFGFHNVLRLLDGGLGFVDFEYAGLDSPAKAIGDFVCQPDFPPPPGALGVLAMAVGRDAESGRELAGLVCRLLPLFRIKFCCIILNDFKKLDDRRRNFARAEVRRERLDAQLRKAQDYFGRFHQ
ncbi:MAG: aminoglycoside phosphotransferase family protein [Planctomycetota bacterium]|jgi:hypothetical protein|nr:aminoglycoside phosphotransferase family protein [Planctomycetota bacterium]